MLQVSPHAAKPQITNCRSKGTAHQTRRPSTCALGSNCSGAYGSSRPCQPTPGTNCALYMYCTAPLYRSVHALCCCLAYAKCPEQCMSRMWHGREYSRERQH